MQTPALLDSLDYKAYLNQRLDADPRGRGRRAALAKAVGCQNAYVSSVLRGASHFTPEQGEAINEHLGHSEAEGEYFLLLLQLSRAGTDSLRARLHRQLQRLRDERFNLKRRLAVGQALSREDQATYYSDWVYAAVHTLTSVPEFTTTPAIGARLGLAPARAAEIVEFLLNAGLVARGKGGLKIGQARIHLGADSPLIAQHHRNWRLQAMQKLSRGLPEDLHYSSVVTLSAKDVTAVKERIVAAIGEVKETVRASKEERLHSFSVDFFEV